MKMGPILTFLIILINQLEKSEAREASYIGNLTTLQHGVSGDIHSTDDEMVLEIKNFKYDGKGPDAFFYVGKKGTEPNSDGIRLPYPENSDQKLGEFNGETIKINLPKEIRFDEIGWLSVWCRKFSVDFGHWIENYGSSNVNIDENHNENDHYGSSNVNIDEKHEENDHYGSSNVNIDEKHDENDHYGSTNVNIDENHNENDHYGSTNVNIDENHNQNGHYGSTNVNIDESEASKHSDYDGCNQDRGCFGLQEGCTSSGNCPAMVTYQYLQDSNQFQFKLHIKSVDSGRYVAVGFSNDPKMGDDLVIFCSTEDGASPQLSWNKGKSNIQGVQGLDLLQKISVTAVDGAKSCDFTLPNELKFTPPGGSEQKSYDIGSGKYHMLLSIGPFESSTGNLFYHSDKVVSAKPLNLKSFKSVELQAKGWMAQIHGFLMILAWMGSAASGMMLARYFKKTWRSVRPFDKDLWFRLHQLFMSFTVLSTIAGIVVIAIDRGNAPLSLEQVKKNPHPALGMVCIITAFIQPLMALLRPHPESDKRWVFNIAHFLFGNISYTFAIAAIFKAMEYSELEMPENVVYLLMAYVIVHVLIHFTLTGQRWCSEKNIENQVKDIDNNEPLDAPGSGFRKSMAFFYIGFVFIISFSLIGWMAYVHSNGNKS